MPLLKPIAGKGSCRKIQHYLEKHNRALARDLINLDESKDAQSWSRQMDQTRVDLGTDIAKRGRAPRTFVHYVLSPDPVDKVSLEDMRLYAMEWVEAAFKNNYQVAIVYHNDNSERLANGLDGIMHAHVVINNAALFNKRGSRLSSYLTNSKVREINQLAQDLAEKRGWHTLDLSLQEREQDSFEKYQIDIETKRSEQEQEKQRSWRYSTKKNYYTKEEVELIKKEGWSWKEEIRLYVQIATHVSIDMRQFEDTLNVLGISITRTKKQDDLVYSFIDMPTRKVTGHRLGYVYSYDSINKSFERLSSQDLRSKLFLQGCANDLTGYIKERSKIVGHIRCGSDITLQDIADAMNTAYKCKVSTMDELKELANTSKGSEKQELCHRAYNVFQEMGRQKTVIKAGYKHDGSTHAREGHLKSPEELAETIKKRHSEAKEQVRNDRFAGKNIPTPTKAPKPISPKRNRTTKEWER